jgi:hypothetical protein
MTALPRSRSPAGQWPAANPPNTLSASPPDTENTLDLTAAVILSPRLSKEHTGAGDRGKLRAAAGGMLSDQQARRDSRI